MPLIRTLSKGKKIWLMMVIGLCFQGVGCSHSQKQGFEVSLLGTPKQNEGRPVVVRFYQLKRKEKFERAGYRELQKDDEKTLEGELVAWKEKTLYPDSKEVLDLEIYIGEGVEYLGVAAFFQKPGENGWRNLVSIQDRGFCEKPWFTDLKVILEENQLILGSRC